jgi:hypothetical protein
VLSAERVLGGLVLVKALDLALRGPTQATTAVWLGLLVLWVAGGVALIAAPSRLAWTAVLVAGLGLLADAPLELRRQHLVLLVGVALVAAVAHDGERLLLWRTQLSALYGIAALAKLNESFLAGGVMAAALTGGPYALPPLPLPLLLALGGGLVTAELLLATAPWAPRLRRPATAAAAGLHGIALLVVGGGPLVTLRLVVFGGTAVALQAASAGLLAVRPCAPRR